MSSSSMLSRFRRCLARGMEALRELLERYGLILPPKLATRKKFMRNQQKIIDRNLVKFGVSQSELTRLISFAKGGVPKEMAYAEKQGIQTSAIRLEEMLVLHMAAREGQENCVRLLLHYGFDPNSRDSEGRVPLWESMWGVMGKRNGEKVTKLLLDNGANLFSGDIGEYACKAARCCRLDLLEEMVRYGADITLSGKDGNTALSFTCVTGDIKLVQFLLDQGADGPPGKDAKEYIKEQFRVNIKALKEKYLHSSMGALKVQSCGGYSTRVTISCLESDTAPKLVGLPQTLEELIDLSTSKFGIAATKVLTKDRAEIDDISLIRDGDQLILAGDNQQSGLNQAVTMLGTDVNLIK